MRSIRRYSNRALHDTQTSRDVTLMQELMPNSDLNITALVEAFGRQLVAAIEASTAQRILAALKEVVAGQATMANSLASKVFCAEGLENHEVARRLSTSAHTVGRWRAQFLAAGTRRLQDARTEVAGARLALIRSTKW